MRAHLLRAAAFGAALTVALGAPAAKEAPPSAPPKTTRTVQVGPIQLSTSLDNSHVLKPSKGLVRMAIDLKAAKVTGVKRLPLNVALVVDRSGSMRGDKIAQTRAAARHLVAQLREGDILAIVSYADDVRVDLPASDVDAEVRTRALRAIQGLEAGGSTNLSGGLIRGQSEVERNLRTGQVNRVILMSDGIANRGITDTKLLAQAAQKTSQRGISVTTIGVGADYNEDLMTAVADHAGGNYYFVEKPSQIAGIFTQELQRMFATVAQGAVVEVRLDDGVDLKQVFGYTFTQRGDLVSIPLSEVFGGQRRSILLAVQVPVVRLGSLRVGDVTLKYSDATAKGAQRTAKTDLFVTVTDNKQTVERNRNRSVEERVGEVEVAAAMTRAADLLKEGRLDAAKKVLRGQMARNAERARRLGGSARLAKQGKELKTLEKSFDGAGAAPAARAATVKRTKAAGRTLAR